MDLISFGFLAVMVLVGGVVAYIADNLGRTLGKKRLSLRYFGRSLRPRHTATLLTVAAGMLIPFLTVVAVATVSYDVRIWIAEGRQAIAQRDAALQEKAAATRDVQRLSSERNELNDQNKKLAQENQSRRTKLREVERDLREQRKLLASSKEQVRVSAAKIATLASQVAVAHRDLTETNQALTHSRAALATAKTNLEQVKTARDKLQASLSQLQLSYNELKTQIDDEFKRNVDLQKENRKLESDLEKLSNDKLALSREVEATGRELDATRKELEGARTQLEEVRGQLALSSQMLRVSIDKSRYRPMIFAIGQELARVQVPSGVTEKQAKEYLAKVLTQASEEAKARGAAPLPDATLAAGLLDRPDDQDQTISVEEQERRLTKSIVDSKTDLVLVATSFHNAFQGEYVVLNVRPFRNPLVYRAGQTIAERRINGNESEESILREITEFLQKSVRDKALKDRMIPVAGTEQFLGEVGSDDILQLVKSIRAHDRPVRLAALASGDTRAADPLRLEFRIR